MCSCADLGPGAACASCRKSKKRCDWTTWNTARPGPGDASSSATIPGPSTSGGSIGGATSGHKSCPSVEALKEIAAEIRAFQETYEKGHAVDESKLAQVEHRAMLVEWRTAMTMDAIWRFTAVILGDRKCTLAPF